jgi:hypothetical protein
VEDFYKNHVWVINKLGIGFVLPKDLDFQCFST